MAFLLVSCNFLCIWGKSNFLSCSPRSLPMGFCLHPWPSLSRFRGGGGVVTGLLWDTTFHLSTPGLVLLILWCFPQYCSNISFPSPLFSQARAASVPVAVSLDPRLLWLESLMSPMNSLTHGWFPPGWWGCFQRLWNLSEVALAGRNRLQGVTFISSPLLLPVPRFQLLGLFPQE